MWNAGNARPRALSVLAAVTAAGYTTAVLALTWRRSCFFGDDFSAFDLARASSFWEAVFSHLGGQYVPLHRAVTFALYRAFPMQWGATQVVLGSFHVLGVVLLYRVMELLRPSRVNAVLAALYATNVFAGLQFTWWSSGLTRAPYVALALVAIDQYLRPWKPGSLRPPAAIAIAFLLALGFYAKAILIPLYCVGLDLAWRGRAALTGRQYPRWLLVMALLVVSAAYAIAARSALSEVGQRTAETGFVLSAVGTGLLVLGHALFGSVLEQFTGRPTPWMALPWLALFAWSVWRVPRVLRVWIVAALLLGANVALIAASFRGVLFKMIVALDQRYVFEQCFLVFIALGMVVHCARDRAPELRWLVEHGRSRRVTVSIGVGLVSYALWTFSGFERLSAAVPDPRVCLFLENITTDLRELRDAPAPVTLQDGYVPSHIEGLNLEPRPYSNFIPLLGYAVSFSRSGTHRVADDGHVVAVKRRRSRGRR